MPQAIDRDNSGYITAAELSKLGTKMNQVRCHFNSCLTVSNFQAKTEALMNKLDQDGDGNITLDEFRELFRGK